jgi:hypothetical protein
MPAIKPDMRSRTSMGVGAPGEWKHKPQPIPSREVRPPRVVDPIFKANPSKKPASTGPKPTMRELSTDELRERQAQDGKANAGDVHGHNERQRAELPNKPLTPNTYGFQPKRRTSSLGMTTFGPAFRVKGGNRKKKKKAPQVQAGFVTEVPERLKKYASA